MQRIVDALSAEHFLIPATPTAGVRLGPGLIRLAASASVEFDQITRPIIARLSQTLKETVDLSVLKGDAAVFTDQVQGAHRLRAVSAVGNLRTRPISTFSSVADVLRMLIHLPGDVNVPESSSKRATDDGIHNPAGPTLAYTSGKDAGYEPELRREICSVESGLETQSDSRKRVFSKPTCLPLLMYIAYTKHTVITFQHRSLWTCMNAVMHKYDMTEGADMPAGENDNLPVHVAELRADVRHLQADVTDIKADLRVTNQRIESLRKETGERLDKADQRFESFREETAQRFDKVDQKFESVKKEVGEVKDSLASAKIWALGLYFALAGSLLYVLARGFKWL